MEIRNPLGVRSPCFVPIFNSFVCPTCYSRCWLFQKYPWVSSAAYRAFCKSSFVSGFGSNADTSICVTYTPLSSSGLERARWIKRFDSYSFADSLPLPLSLPRTSQKYTLSFIYFLYFIIIIFFFIFSLPPWGSRFFVVSILTFHCSLTYRIRTLDFVYCEFGINGKLLFNFCHFFGFHSNHSVCVLQDFGHYAILANHHFSWIQF